TSSGSGEDSTAFRFGIATVKPIRAIMPSTAEPTMAQSTPRGTLRTGFTASSLMSAASSNPTSVNAPSSPASANAYQVGLCTTDVVLNSMPPGAGLACVPQSTSSSTPNTTVPMISVNTATLLTRAATWMLMMLITTGSSIKMTATD